MRFRQVARGNVNGLAVALDLLTFFEDGHRQFGGAEPRLAIEIAFERQANERHRVKAVLGGKRLGLVQGFAGDDGDLHFCAAARPVEHQIFDIVRRAPDKGCAYLVATIRVVGAGCLQFQILDLRIWQHQLGGQPTGRQPQGRAAQIPQRLCQIGGIECGFTDLQPTARGAMQKADGGVGYV